MNGTLSLDIKSYWHVGAGHGAGRYLDAAALRDDNGLPYVPGKTLRGLLRQATRECEQFGHLPPGTESLWFGSPNVDAQNESFNRFHTHQGILFVDNAVLGPQWQNWAKYGQERHVLNGLFETVASTALDEHHMALDGSLRRIEVVVPMCLTARWSVSAPEPGLPAQLQCAADLVRALGHRRHRGLGRVKVEVMA